MHSFALRRVNITHFCCAHSFRPRHPAFGLCRALLPPLPRPSKFRFFGHLARDSATTTNTSSKPIKEGKESSKEEIHLPTKTEQRRSDWAIIKQLLSNVWPKNDWRTRGTVLFGFMMLISAKARIYSRCLRDSQ